VHSNPQRRSLEGYYGIIISSICHPRSTNPQHRKIPWRMSAPQKLRQRRRLRRVDNIIAVLDTALQRSRATTSRSTLGREEPNVPALAPTQSSSHSKASPAELSNTAEGRRLLDAETGKSQDERRHGRGPKQGEFLPGSSRIMLRDIVRNHGTTKLLERWKVEMPTEADMLPRDKYTMFDRKVRGYRKGVHKLPKWTRVSQRLNPPGF